MAEYIKRKIYKILKSKYPSNSVIYKYIKELDDFRINELIILSEQLRKDINSYKIIDYSLIEKLTACESKLLDYEIELKRKQQESNNFFELIEKTIIDRFWTWKDQLEHQEQETDYTSE